MSNYFDSSNPSKPITEAVNESFFFKISAYIQFINDKLLYYKIERWIGAGIMFLFYLLRIVIFTGGYYAMTYCIGIHVLNSFLGFISPLEDPDENDEGESYLPQK